MVLLPQGQNQDQGSNIKDQKEEEKKSTESSIWQRLIELFSGANHAGMRKRTTTNRPFSNMIAWLRVRGYAPRLSQIMQIVISHY